MPILHAKAGRWDQLFGLMVCLWLDPNSFKSSRITFRDMQGHALQAARKKFGKKAKLTEKDIDLIYQVDPRGMRLPTSIQTGFAQGMMAGAILLTVLRLADRTSAPASVEQALRIVGPQFKKEGLGGGRASLMKAWGKYKSTSHFFAAALHNPKEFKKMNSLLGFTISKRSVAEMPDDLIPLTAKNIQSAFDDIPRFVRGYKKLMGDVIPRFFATAERFRELGEKHYAPGQKKRGLPLLDKEKMWRIPSGFEFPAIKIVFKRLSNAERAAIT